MKNLSFIYFVSSFVFSFAELTMKQGSLEKNKQQCKKLAKDPYFEPELVVGKPWRVYYTWNMKMDTICMDLVFKKATPKIIQRIRSDMSDYIEQQPYWDSAALHLTAGPAREMLLFPAEGAAGGFLGVPNVVRHGDMSPVRNGVPLLKFQLKLVRDGKYLVMMDCHIGVASLSARTENPPYRLEIATSVAELDIGDGFPACTQEKNKEEQFFVK